MPIIGIVLVALFCGAQGPRPPREDDVDLASDEFGCELGEEVGLALRVSMLEGDVLAFDIPRLA
jgi:hypothetical protein